MTLEEQFRPHSRYWDCFNDEPTKYDHNTKCVKIADEFAIGFAEWYLNLWHIDDDSSFDDNSPKELLKIYKQEKGL